MHGLARRAGHDSASASDVFQEVAIRLWKGLSRLRQRESLAPWLATTTNRLAWRLRARSKARSAREKASAREEGGAVPDPSSTLASVEDEQAVRRALGSLGERCRRLLRALYFEASPASYDDVSARLGIPRGSIGPTRQRCLQRLREELERLGLSPTYPPAPRQARPR